ncbi:MAG: polyketide synthase, partial [Ilumatobacteraceae bacterium]|nr:polyketide synthase [Ilumatobacteraceae bacterium]
RLLGDALGADQPCRGIVDAWPAAIPNGDEGIVVARGGLGCRGLLHLVHALDSAEWNDRPPRLWLVTRGAQAAGPGAVRAAQALVWGFGRVLATERPGWACTLIDVDPGGAAGDDHDLFDELHPASQDRQVALRASTRTVARLARRVAATAMDAPSPTASSPSDEYRIVAAEPGTLSSLRPRLVARRPAGRGEVELRIEASGLNFLDVLKAMGIYPGLAPSPHVALGAECAGTIVAVGADVQGFAVGDRVVAITPSFEETSMLASFVTLPAAFVAPRPDHLSASAAASIPVAMLTAHYALAELGRVRRGEKVLIHAAAGGVGLAALQICRRAGADVLATAGSPEKRDYLRSLGVEHVFDSRTIAFAAEVLAATGGRGVDLVLNSLVGEAIHAGLAVLAPGGRFLELGKRDVYADARIGLESFKQNRALFVIDIAGMTAQDPDRVAAMFQDVMAVVATGELGSLPTTTVPITEAADAFRAMAQARHIGKLVLTGVDGPVNADVPTVRPDGTYLITGGLGALGLATARHLVDRGARSLALLGRTAPNDDAAIAIAGLEANGAQIVVVAADVADREQLARALQEVGRQLPPLRGVIHAAGVLADATIGQLDGARLQAALAPKVAGAWNLHTLTQHQPLDLFVMFSSVAGLLGLAGQANYAAGNAFLDALAHERRAAGLPAQSIAWGPWGEIGLAATDANRGGRLAARGLGGLVTADALAAFDALLVDGDIHAAVMPFDAARWAASDPGAQPLLGPLLEQVETQSVRAGLRDSLLAAPEGRRRRGLLEDAVCAELAPVLRLAPERINRRRPLKAMGLDSLMALELRNRLERETNLTLSATLAFNYPTVALLAAHLAERMDVELEPVVR